MCAHDFVYNGPYNPVQSGTGTRYLVVMCVHDFERCASIILGPTVLKIPSRVVPVPGSDVRP